MAFIPKIVLIGTDTVPNYSQQLFDKQKAAAESAFDVNLEAEVKRQLKANNIDTSNMTEAEWDAFIAARLTKFTVTDTNTSIISLDAIMDGSNNITDIGTKLVEWQGDGYEIKIIEPQNTITNFE
jgi:hypothetical protein